MTDPSDVVSVGLYLHGNGLDPEVVSSSLGVKPTKAYRKGERLVTSAKLPYIRKIGFWAVEVKEPGTDIEHHISKLVEFLKNGCTVDIAKLEGVTEAYIDVFVATNADNGAGEARFEISAKNLGLLSALGLPIHFTICSIDAARRLAAEPG